MKYKVKIVDAQYGNIRGLIDMDAYDTEDLLLCVETLSRVIGTALTVEVEFPTPVIDDIPEATV